MKKIRNIFDEIFSFIYFSKINKMTKEKYFRHHFANFIGPLPAAFFFASENKIVQFVQKRKSIDFYLLISFVLHVVFLWMRDHRHPFLSNLFSDFFFKEKTKSDRSIINRRKLTMVSIFRLVVLTLLLISRRSRSRMNANESFVRHLSTTNQKNFVIQTKFLFSVFGREVHLVFYRNETFFFLSLSSNVSNDIFSFSLSGQRRYHRQNSVEQTDLFFFSFSFSFTKEHFTETQ